MKLNWGRTKNLIKVIRVGTQIMTPEIRTMGQAVVFNFRMGQKLTQIFKIPSGALSIYREVVPPEHRSKEARSNQRKLKK